MMPEMSRTEVEWQARERQLLDANSRAIERARKAEARVLLWQQQATSATPGGSEFCDPMYCGEYLRQQRRALCEVKLEAGELRKRILKLGDTVTI